MNPQITIAVCTRNRPVEVEKCLRSLINQETKSSYEIVCVENDGEQKSKPVIEALIPVAHQKGIDLRYYCQPVQNIGLTRNLCIAKSRGTDFIAFIDDDEWTAEDWLEQLVEVQKTTQADVVAGTVHQVFPDAFPLYMRQCKMYQLEVFDKAYCEIEGVDANTTLYKRDLFDLREVPFDPDFGLTGGGDKEFAFFIRNHGRKAVKTSLAKVYEYQPMSRARWWYQWDRSFRGTVNLYRVVRKYAGRQRSMEWILKRLVRLPWKMVRELPLFFIHPRLSLVNFGCLLAFMLALLLGPFSIRKRGYY